MAGVKKKERKHEFPVSKHWSFVEVSCQANACNQSTINNYRSEIIEQDSANTYTQSNNDVNKNIY